MPDCGVATTAEFTGNSAPTKGGALKAKAARIMPGKARSSRRRKEGMVVLHGQVEFSRMSISQLKPPAAGR